MVKIISNYVSVHILFFNRLSDEIGEIQIMPTFHPAERTFVFTGSDPVSEKITFVMTRKFTENKIIQIHTEFKMPKIKRVEVFDKFCNKKTSTYVLE